MTERMTERTRSDRRNPANRLKIPDLMTERTPENFLKNFTKGIDNAQVICYIQGKYNHPVNRVPAMLAYQTKTYEHFFWKFYKEAFKQAVKGFFRADEHRKGEFLNYFKYLQAYKTAYSCDDRKNTKWGDFVVTWVKTHTISAWTTGLVFHYHKEEPLPDSNAVEDKMPTLNEDEQQALYVYVTANASYPFAGQEMDRHISAYEACANAYQRSWMLAFCRWFFNAPADLYDELSLLD